jgi:hypothetical protein
MNMIISPLTLPAPPGSSRKDRDVEKLLDEAAASPVHDLPCGAV